MPSVHPGESQQDYVHRCVGDKGMVKEFPKQSQRVAVCFSLFRQHQKNKKSKGEKAIDPDNPTNEMGDAWTLKNTDFASLNLNDQQLEQFESDLFAIAYTLDACPSCVTEIAAKLAPQYTNTQDLLNKVQETVAGSVKVNNGGVSHAHSLVRAGKVSHSDSWSAPSSDKENAYIDKHGIDALRKFYLGTHTDVDKKLKGSLAFPYSSDFETVNRRGIIACKQRAAQAGYTAIEKAADSILSAIDGKSESKGYIGSYKESNGKIEVEMQKIDDIDWNNLK